MPLVNEDTDAVESGQSQLSNSQVDYGKLWDYAEKSPEVLIPCWTIINDIISDGYKLVPYGKEGSKAGGKNKKLKADKFLRDNFYKTEIAPALLWDALITGDYYLYTPKLTEDKISETLEEVVDGLPLQSKMWSANYIYNKFAMDLTFGATNLVPLPSSTMTIKHDIHQKVLAYHQRVAARSVDFSPKEVIHGKLLPVNGKVYGFTPLKSILSELSIISAAKDTIGYGFEGGGVPPQAWILRDKDPGSPSYNDLKGQLKKWKALQNKNRPLIATGDLEVKDLTKSAKDMMYNDLLRTFSEIVIMVWGVPPSKMGMTSSESGGYDSGLATEGYYRRISNMQDWFYERLNWELMIPQFGVQVVPNKAYRQDEVRETQVLLQKVQAAKDMIGQGWVNNEYVMELLLSIPEEYRGSGEPRMMQQDNQIGFDKDASENSSKQGINEMKRDKQNDKVIKEVKAATSDLNALIDKVDSLETSSKVLYDNMLHDIEEKSVKMNRLFEQYRDVFVEETKGVIREEVSEIVANELSDLKSLRSRLVEAIDDEEEGS